MNEDIRGRGLSCSLAARDASPLRHSSMKGGFWVQRLIDIVNVAGDADVAADAFADVLDPAFLDLLRQKGSGEWRAARSDQSSVPEVSCFTITSGEVKRPHGPPRAAWSAP